MYTRFLELKAQNGLKNKNWKKEEERGNRRLTCIVGLNLLSLLTNHCEVSIVSFLERFRM